MARIGDGNKSRGLIFSLDKPPIEPGWLADDGVCTYTALCDYSTGNCYASLAECQASFASSSSSSFASSSSTGGSSSSSLFSVTTVLGANPENPNYCFVEIIGLQMVSLDPATLVFSYTGLIGNIFSVNVNIDSQLVASIYLSDSYANQAFQFFYGSTTYSGTFPSGNGEVNFTT